MTIFTKNLKKYQKPVYLWPDSVVLFICTQAVHHLQRVSPNVSSFDYLTNNENGYIFYSQKMFKNDLNYLKKYLQLLKIMLY